MHVGNCGEVLYIIWLMAFTWTIFYFHFCQCMNITPLYVKPGFGAPAFFVFIFGYQKNQPKVEDDDACARSMYMMITEHFNRVRYEWKNVLTVHCRLFAVCDFYFDVDAF